MAPPSRSRCQTGRVPDDLARWGADAPILGERVRDYLARHVGVASPWPPADTERWVLGASRLSDSDLDAMRSVVGDDHVSVERDDRLRAMGGAAFIDYARRRAGEVDDAPDAVVSPATHDEVVALLAVAREHGLAVIPVGGGTSVVGGLRTHSPHIALDLRRLGRLIHLDEISGVATVGPAITGPVLEALLAARGFTLGHLPQSWERATIGGYVATRSAGQASTGYGRSDDMVEAVVVATPEGTMQLGRAPSTAAGPDLRGLIIGSEGAFGVITRVSLRVRRLPTARIYDAIMLPGFAAGVEAFRDAVQSRSSADVMRLSDEAETATTLLMSGPHGIAARAFDRYLRARGVADPSLAILGWEGTDRDLVGARRSATLRALRRHGAVSLGHGPGQSWRRHRFDGPHLRDSLMDAGYLVETLETATHWSTYLDLHTTVTDALCQALREGQGVGPYVMSHLSHSYDTGASLYTTVIAVADRRDPVGQWQRAKTAASRAIMDSGATITHHHAIGRDHAPWLVDEVGPLGIDVLRAVKSTLDPDVTLNPGVLGLE